MPVVEMDTIQITKHLLPTALGDCRAKESILRRVRCEGRVRRITNIDLRLAAGIHFKKVGMINNNMSYSGECHSAWHRKNVGLCLRTSKRERNRFSQHSALGAVEKTVRGCGHSDTATPSCKGRRHIPNNIS